MSINNIIQTQTREFSLEHDGDGDEHPNTSWMWWRQKHIAVETNCKSTQTLEHKESLMETTQIETKKKP